MSRRRHVHPPLEIEAIESGELSMDDVEALADFIARCAYVNLRKAQDSTNQLIKSTLEMEAPNDNSTDCSRNE